MRIPRNYASAMLSGKNRTGGSYSLLQSALSRTGRGRRLNRSAQILSGLQRKNNIFSNTVQGTAADKQKLYYNMKYHAQQVCEYGNKLADQSKTSLFAKAKESGSNAEITANIKGLVGQYNSMLGNLRESGTRTDYSRASLSYSARIVGTSSSLSAYSSVSAATTGSTEICSNPSSARCMTSSAKSRLCRVKVPLT